MKWHQSAPSLFSAYLLGQFWENVATKARGGAYSVFVSQQSWDNAEIAKDMAFYWYLKAIEIDHRCLWLLDDVMSLTGYLKLPYWFGSGEINFSELDYYSEASIEYLQQYGGFLPQSLKMPQILPVPTEQEMDYPIDYWFNRILAFDAEFIPAFETYVHYLYPRWSGQDHENIDQFLQSPICQALPTQKFNRLLVKKYSDWLISDYPELDDVEQINRYEKKFEELLQLDLPNHIKADFLCEFIDFTDYYVTDIDYELHSDSHLYAQKLYRLIEQLIEQYSSDFFWLANWHDKVVAALCWTMLKFPGLISDTADLRLKLLQLCFAHQDSAFIYVLVTSASHAGIWGVKAGEFTFDPHTCMALEDKESKYGVTDALRYIAMAGAKDTVLHFMHGLAEAGHVSSMYALSQLYDGEGLGQEACLIDVRDSVQAQNWFKQALDTNHPKALYEAGDQIYQKLDFENDPNKDEVNQALQHFKKALDLKVFDAHQAYFHLIQKTGTHQQRENLLIKIMPDQMHDTRHDAESLAWIAQLYGICSYNGHGLKENRYLALYWINQALRLDPEDEHYILLQNDWSKPTGWLFAKSKFKSRLEAEQNQIPEWMLPIMNKFERLADATDRH